MSKAIDKKIFYTPKERMGQPWTYKDETISKLEADKIAADEAAKGTVTVVRPFWEGSPTNGRKLSEKPFVQSGPRIKHTTAKVGSQRSLPSEFVNEVAPKVVKKDFSNPSKLPRRRFSKNSKLKKQRFKL